MTDSSGIWTGAASNYDRARPSPPPALLDLLTQVIDAPHPALIVDLGSGTGLSSTVWSGRAERVIGIEPNADMRQNAMRNVEGDPNAASIEYREGTAQRTGLPDGCADIVTCAQAFHWMEPAATLAEVARILRPGGLFAAYDYDAPPTITWELDRLAQELMMRFVALIRERCLAPTLKIWPKDKQLDHMRESGHFRFTHEVLLHSIEHGDAARYLAMMRSNALGQQFQFGDQEIGFERLAQAARDYLGAKPIPWYWSYRVRIGVK
jgi:ubiquinone/menaquinone biosynthesis C-methylase UbiE